jgi:hypothetical protein
MSDILKLTPNAAPESGRSNAKWSAIARLEWDAGNGDASIHSTFDHEE